MGLAGAKNKKKWAKDPNNNAWSRNTDTFGQKIMRSQGWAPGDYLGAKDASHSEYYGAANASHIRAVLKDDNMGLGAKRNQGDECVGLDAFQELLGRLNGKSEESLDEARKKREEANINKYLHRKLGTVRFVFAGYLVGDKVQALADELKREKEAEGKAKDEATTEGKKEKRSKKRKAEAEAEDSTMAAEEKRSKKSKAEDTDEDAKAARRREKKEKKRREKEASKEDSTESTAEAEENKSDEIAEDDSSSSRKKSKKEKKEKKEKRNKSRDAEEAEASDSLSKKKKKKKEKKSQKDEETNSTDTSVAPTPLASGSATPIPHRHLARQRFIAQKRAAVMDQAALNQIFMIKT